MGYAAKMAAVIPAYNEADKVAAVVEGSLSFVDAVVVVDDCSSDRTREAAEAAGAVVISHERNRGKGAALHTGLRWAGERGFAAAVTLDADGQHDPAEIPRLVRRFRATSADIVVGTRMRNRADMPLDRALTNLVTSIVISAIAGTRISDSQCGFRLIRLATAGRLRIATSRFESESEILVKAARRGMKIVEAPVTAIYRDEESKINPFKDTCRFIRMSLRLIFVDR